MAQVAYNYTTPVDICELSLRFRLRKAGMRLERRGFNYRLMSGNQVLLDRGPDGFGLSLVDVLMFTDGALNRRAYR